MRRLFHAQSREKPELDDPSLVAIQSGKALERLVNGKDVSRCGISAVRSGPAARQKKWTRSPKSSRVGR
jgi:hypothetical protein